MTAFNYPGDELALFARAVHWKRYFRGQIRPFIGGAVLEVGAGLGSTTLEFLDLPWQSWTCLEPDGKLLEILGRRLPSGRRPQYHLLSGTTENLTQPAVYDSIIYVDVLEHIARDEEELNRAGHLLRPGGHLAVLSPAHQFLYSEYDARICHLRRYSRKDLPRLTCPGLVAVRCRYLDAAGLLVSAGNRMLLRQSLPSLKQVLSWDRFLVPLSRLLDPLTFFRLGKSILFIWKKESAA